MLRRALLGSILGSPAMVFGRGQVGFQNPGEVLARNVVIEGTNDNLRVYQGKPALGNLVYTIRPNLAPAPDKYGNLMAGETSYYINASLHYWVISLSASGGSANASIGVSIFGPRATPGAVLGPSAGSWTINSTGGSNFQMVLGDSNGVFPPITTALLELQKTTAGIILSGLLETDTVARFNIDANGKIQWGPGGAVALDTDLYRLAAASLKTDGALTVGGVLTTQASNLNNDPASPAATASLTQVMMGLGSSWTLTPHSSGKVLVIATGTATTNTAVATVKWGGRFGTGTAPVNGAADTGTHWGPANDPSTKPNAAAVGVPFALNAILSLTAGTTYWFDLAVSTSIAADTAAVQNLAFTAIETP